jgi:hypothetical protein
VARRKTAAVHLQAVAAAEVFREWEGGGRREAGATRAYIAMHLASPPPPLPPLAVSLQRV